MILNLQSADTELSKRLIDFASGLTYALDGGMQRVADKVFLLTPRNVEVSAEERARMLERAASSTRPEAIPLRSERQELRRLKRKQGTMGTEAGLLAVLLSVISQVRDVCLTSSFSSTR